MSIYSKIASIQDELGNIKKDATNPHFKNTYATYEKCIEVIYPLLRKHELVVYHGFAVPETGSDPIITTTIKEIGEDKMKTSSFSQSLKVPLVKNDPQALGSAITYAKRYMLLAMLGLGTEDDDGEAATRQEEAPSQYGTCDDCGSDKVKNPRTGKVFCSAKCWLNRDNKTPMTPDQWIKSGVKNK